MGRRKKISGFLDRDDELTELTQLAVSVLSARPSSALGPIFLRRDKKGGAKTLTPTN